jgi:hypothetical protein
MGTPRETPPSFSAGRRFGAGFNVLLGIVAMAAILVMVNFLSARHYRRVALSAERDYKLSPTTQQVLAGLTNDVKVIVYFDPEDALFSHITGLLKEYSLRNPRIRVDTVNYGSEPGKAELVKATYKLPPATRDIVIFDAGGPTKVVRSVDLSNYDISEVTSGTSQNIRRKSFNGEQHFTSALITVTERSARRAYFLFGHGEHDPRDNVRDTGYGRLVALLSEMNVESMLLTVGGTNDIPAGANLVIVGAPGFPVPADEQDKLHNFLVQGGRVLVLFRVLHTSGLEPLLARWGVDVHDQYVTDRAASTRSDTSVVIANYSTHEIVRPLSQAAVPLILAPPRPVGRRPDFPQVADAPQVHELASTTYGGEAILDYRNGLRRDPLRDRRGVIPIAVAVQNGGVKGEARGTGATRMVVVGDSLFLDNQMLDRGPANRDFAWNAVNWLLDRSALLGIAPQPIREFKFDMTDAKLARVHWLVLGAIPGAVLLWGWLVFIRRRN